MHHFVTEMCTHICTFLLQNGALWDMGLVHCRICTVYSITCSDVSLQQGIWNGKRSLPWRHNGHDSVSNHQPHGCLLNRLFRRRSKKTSKLRVTGLCVGNSPGPVNSPHKGPVTRKMFPFDDVITLLTILRAVLKSRLSTWYNHRPLCTSQWHQSVSNHWQYDYLFNSLLRLTTKNIPKLCIIGIL